MPESSQERRRGTLHLKTALELAHQLADVELQTEAEKATRILAGFYSREHHLRLEAQAELSALKAALN